jgi:FtsH-binding integral membrane protein
MYWLITKYLITAAVVVVVSEIAKRSDKLGALVAALPLVTVLVLIWMHMEHQTPEKLARHAGYTFWYVIPTLPMFLVFPPLQARLGFWWALAVSCAVTALCFGILSLIARRFGVDLLP